MSHGQRMFSMTLRQVSNFVQSVSLSADEVCLYPVLGPRSEPDSERTANEAMVVPEVRMPTTIQEASGPSSAEVVRP